MDLVQYGASPFFVNAALIFGNSSTRNSGELHGKKTDATSRLQMQSSSKPR